MFANNAKGDTRVQKTIKKTNSTTLRRRNKTRGVQMNKNVKYLIFSDRQGFACNHNQCPLGAEYGYLSIDKKGYSDVLCEDHARDKGWL